MAKKRNTASYLTKKRTKGSRTRTKRTGNKQNLKIQLSVSQGAWGDIQPNKIAVLLQDTAFQINRLLRIPFHGRIQVIPSPLDHPRILYRSSPSEPYTIWISARDNFWCQFAYQFAHEFCHALSNYEKIKENPNNWFHEAICELASIFTIQCMAQRWRTRPPFPNQKNYAAALKEYSQNLLKQLPEGMSLNDWLSLHEDELRETSVNQPEQRNNQALVASQLLPVFQQTPSGWNAIRKLPILTRNLQTTSPLGIRQLIPATRFL